MLLQIWSDLRYAARRLGATPGFTASAVATIALGAGINAGVFSVLNGIALRELPAPDADELVTIDQLIEGGAPYKVEGSSSMVSSAEYRAYRDGARALTGILGYSTRFGFGLTDEVDRSITGTFVTCGYFDVLRQPPALGRGFTAEDCEPGAAPTVVLGYDVWTSVFGADSRLVGRSIALSDQAFTVVGVAAEGMRGLDFVPVSYFAPIATQPLLYPDRDMYGDGTKWLKLVGRKADDASLAQVRAELGLVAAQIDGQEPSRKTTLVIDRARRLSDPSLQPTLLGVGGVVMTAFGLVLLIACANVANLLLARGLGRSREIAVRLSLGASRARVVQSLLAESLLIGAAGGGLGLAFAVWSLQGIVAFVLSRVPGAPELLIDTGPDIRVLSFALLLSLATGVLCGLVPALQASRPDLHTAMKLDALGPGRHAGTRLQGTLVGVQVAVCMVLMIAAGLLLRGVYTAQTIDPGFSYDDVSVVSLASRGSSDTERTTNLATQLIDRIGSLPGIDAIAQVGVAPLSMTTSMSSARLPEGEAFVTSVNTVSSGYFGLVGIPIVRGRTFTEDELADASAAVVVTETTARRLWPGQEPIGQTIVTARADIRTGESLPERAFEVVGVARDAQVRGLGETPSAYLYLPATPETRAGLRLLVRSRLDLVATAAVLRTAVAEIDPNFEVRVEPLEANLDLWRDLSALVSTLATSLAALALVLATVGIYGVVAYAVGRRAREIGIRLALGASVASVLELMLRRTMRPVLIGAVIGIAAAAGVSRVLSSVLFGVSPVDPLALATAALVVTGVALAAGALSARRAARVDPIRTLHYE
jgi:predicted permease